MRAVALIAVSLACAVAANSTGCAPREPCLRALHETCAQSGARFAHEQPLPVSHPSRAPCAACFGLDANRTFAPKRFCQLHIPKTGSAFARTIRRFACPRLAEREGADAAAACDERVVRPFYGHGHAALTHLLVDAVARRWTSAPALQAATRRAAASNLSRACPYESALHKHHLGHQAEALSLFLRRYERVATMLRAPRQRVLSDPLHRWMGPAALPLARASRDAEQRYLDEADATLAAHGAGSREARAAKAAAIVSIANLPGRAACAAKMLAGLGCADPPGEACDAACERAALADDVLPAARAALARAAFVGLTARWRDSVCLFHAMHGGAPLPSQFGPLRDGDKQQQAPRVEREGVFFATARTAELARQARPAPCADARYDETLLGGWEDATDEAVYAVAVARFERDMRAHTSCPPGNLGVA